MKHKNYWKLLYLTFRIWLDEHTLGLGTNMYCDDLIYAIDDLDSEAVRDAWEAAKELSGKIDYIFEDTVIDVFCLCNTKCSSCAHGQISGACGGQSAYRTTIETLGASIGTHIGDDRIRRQIELIEKADCRSWWAMLMNWKTGVLNGEIDGLGDHVYGNEIVEALKDLEEAKLMRSWIYLLQETMSKQVDDLELEFFCLYFDTDCANCAYQEIKGGCGPGSPYQNALEELGADQIVNVLGVGAIMRKMKEIMGA